MATHQVPLDTDATTPQTHEVFFDFPTPSDLDLTNLYIISTQKYVHAVWSWEDNDKGIYLSYSSNGGRTFTTPRKVISTNGRVRDLQVIAKDDDIVITLIENVDGNDWVRAATGMICGDLTCKFKPCEKVKVEGQLINAYTFFTEDASKDHIYYKKSGSLQIFRREVRHCTRLDLTKYHEV